MSGFREKIWNDAVWSKVIAGLTLAGLLGSTSSYWFPSAAATLSRFGSFLLDTSELQNRFLGLSLVFSLCFLVLAITDRVRYFSARNRSLRTIDRDVKKQKILKLLFDGDGDYDVGVIGKHIDENGSTTKYHLEILVDLGLVAKCFNLNGSIWYNLNSEGRKYFVES